MSAFRHARHAMAALGAAAGEQVDQAALRRGLCHLQQQECGAAQLMLMPRLVSSSGDDPAAQRRAEQTLQECLAQARALGCPAGQQAQPQASRGGGGDISSVDSTPAVAANDEL